MIIRKAKKTDFTEISRLAKKYGLDYSGMERDKFLVVEEKKKIIGIGALRKHKDCIELCSLGVDENYRGQGKAKKLVLSLLGQTKEDIYLTTIIPHFFEKFGFEKAGRIPASLTKDSEWCAGCRKDLCLVMVRRAQ